MILFAIIGLGRVITNWVSIENPIVFYSEIINS
jgi:hypothetical protein